MASAHPGHHEDSHPVVNADDVDHAGRIEKLIRFYQTRVETAPDDPAMRDRLGDAFLQYARITGDHHDFDQATAVFRSSINIDEAGAAPWLGMTYSLAGVHRFEEALTAARSALVRLPERDEPLAAVGDMHFALGNIREADLIFRELAARSISMESLVRLAQVDESLGRLDDADIRYHEALDAGRLLKVPAERLQWLHTVIAEFDLSRGDFAGAEAHLAAVLGPDNDRAIGAHTHRAVWLQAQLAGWRGDDARSLALMRELVKSFPRSLYLTTLAMAEAKAGNAESARTGFDAVGRLLASDADHDVIGHTREYVDFICHHAGDAAGGSSAELARAVSLARRELAQVRHDATAYETLAWALFHVGSVEEAESVMQEALRRGPGSARRLWRASEIFAASDNRIAMERARRRAVEINPNIASMMAHPFPVPG